MRSRIECLCLPLALLAASTAHAQTSTAPAAGVVEPAALAAMDKMSAKLITLPAFALKADVTTEQVLDTGQKLQYGGTVDIRAHRPDAFKISAVSDIQHRDYYFGGGKFTIMAPRLNYYASVPATGSIGQALDKLKTGYGIELPLADLFTWGTDQSLRMRIKSGYLIRPEKIDSRTCTHYAFRQEQVDWQIWIDDSDQLPCKLVITDTTDPSMPQYVAVLHWDLQTQPSAADLAFAPPADAHQIMLVDLAKGDKK
ncbi:DUF2092 domain-containing protein [Sphingobium yanoikuyae]|uniref:DUF2092 domain-containing protein n=1 Tax=Sphingobium yanoikuyae TaxID=13690 RepID=UPI0004E45E31|nr:DUF2092 domain-containing protein [Sphingobium yanoikuyae]KFD25764.1 hypothetical protein IH86_23890 [Sphingobium yanoikuyae]MDV3481860.1 DUF2092 domain-containing protein [Sphingobium yanoikuyae]